MKTVSPTVLALVVTIFVTSAFSTVPIRAIKRAKEKDSPVVTSETKFEVNLKEANYKEKVKLIEEILPKNVSNRPQNSITVPGHEQEPIELGPENTSQGISKKLALEVEYESKIKTIHEGLKEKSLPKTFNNGFSFVFNQNSSSNNLLESLSRKSHGVPWQQDNLQNSPQSLEKEKREKLPRKEESYTLDPGDESFKVLRKEYFHVIPNSFLRSEHESIVAPAQNYLIEPGEKPVAGEVYDFEKGEEELLSNILAKQNLDALVLESAAVLELDSISSLALECLLPPIDEIKTANDRIRGTKSRLSLGVIEESDAKPVNTILNLWASDEDSKHISYFSDYNEDTSTEEEEEEGDGDNVNEHTLVEIITVT